MRLLSVIHPQSQDGFYAFTMLLNSSIHDTSPLSNMTDVVKFIKPVAGRKRAE